MIVITVLGIGEGCLNFCYSCDEFLQLSLKDLIDIISRDELNVRSEEQVSHSHTYQCILFLRLFRSAQNCFILSITIEPVKGEK